ncbi:MAG TPA: ferric reductase-like transmembrane domain-containing protein [Mariniflexile sp.]
MENWQDKIYIAVAKKSPQIISLFWIIYLSIALVFTVGAFVVFTNSPLYQTIYEIGINSGRAALLLLGVVVLPGILGRFGIEIRITRIITLFRRQLGIVVFLLAFTHYHIVRAFLLYSQGKIFAPSNLLFETIGFYTLMLLFLMFLTSNNFSVKKLGRWWKRLHRIVYVILWLLVFHTGLQRISVWSVFIFIFAVLEVASLIYARFKSKQLKQTMINQ